MARLFVGGGAVGDGEVEDGEGKTDDNHDRNVEGCDRNSIED